MTSSIASLLEMLTYQRPHGSATEADFIARYLDVIPNMTRDGFGNRILQLGQSRTLFSCHTDTVHGTEGMQEVLYDDQLAQAYKEDQAPLGADDGAGIWLMLRLIQHRVPGLYVFHRGEEAGGQGSRYIAEHTSKLLKDIDRAIAFDRRGDSDIITHQTGGRCCSDAFAQALATSLDMTHTPCAWGVFTDTANYTALIPECTNVSVGYEREHSANETLDVAYLQELGDAVLDVDWESLPTLRKPMDDYAFDWRLDNYDYADRYFYEDLVYDHPEVAARLLKLCDPHPYLIDKAFDDEREV